jgi:hypothetical protein
MFHHQAEAFQLRQWSGWKHFLNDFIRRESVRTAWQLSKATYDTDFQRFMDERIAEIKVPVPPPLAVPAPPPPPAKVEAAAQPVA